MTAADWIAELLPPFFKRMRGHARLIHSENRIAARAGELCESDSLSSACEAIKRAAKETMRPT